MHGLARTAARADFGIARRKEPPMRTWSVLSLI